MTEFLYGTFACIYAGLVLVACLCAFLMWLVTR